MCCKVERWTATFHISSFLCSTDYLLGVDITEKEKSVSIDVTGLSHREITLLTCLVEVMKEKGGS